MQNPFPARSIDLIEELEELFPPRCIAPGEDPCEAHRYAGQLDLLQYLKNWHAVDAERTQRKS